jgi:pyruvate ferredoxin oxidoreductase beta subunit
MTLTATPPSDLVDLSSIKTVKQVPYTEYFVSGHRTCQGCESALVMRYIAKAAGPRTVVLGSTGCMYVANTSYYTTPWVAQPRWAPRPA